MTFIKQTYQEELLRLSMIVSHLYTYNHIIQKWYPLIFRAPSTYPHGLQPWFCITVKSDSEPDLVKKESNPCRNTFSSFKVVFRMIYKMKNCIHFLKWLVNWLWKVVHKNSFEQMQYHWNKCRCLWDFLWRSTLTWISKFCFL